MKPKYSVNTYTPQVVTLKGAVLERVVADFRANGTPLLVYARADKGKEISAGMVEVEITIRSKA